MLASRHYLTALVLLLFFGAGIAFRSMLVASPSTGSSSTSSSSDSNTSKQQDTLSVQPLSPSSPPTWRPQTRAPTTEAATTATASAPTTTARNDDPVFPVSPETTKAPPPPPTKPTTTTPEPTPKPFDLPLPEPGDFVAAPDDDDICNKVNSQEDADQFCDDDLEVNDYSNGKIPVSDEAQVNSTKDPETGYVGDLRLQVKTICELPPSNATYPFPIDARICPLNERHNVVAVRLGAERVLREYSRAASSSTSKRQVDMKCRAAETQLTDKLLDEMQSVVGNDGPPCVGRAVLKMREVFRRRRVLEAAAASREQASVVSSSSGSGSSGSTNQPQQQCSIEAINKKRKAEDSKINILVPFVLNGRRNNIVFGDQRRILLRSFLETAKPKRDVMHFITDHWLDGGPTNSMHGMITEYRRAALFFKLRKFAQEHNIANESEVIPPLEDVTPQLIDEHVAKVIAIDMRVWNFSAHADEIPNPRVHNSASNERVWFFDFYLNYVLPRLVPPKRIGTVLTTDAKDVVFQDNVFDAITELRLMRGWRRNRRATRKQTKPSVVFGISEIMSLDESAINRIWTEDFIGQKLENRMLRYVPAEMDTTSASYRTTKLNDMTNASIPRILRKFPTGAERQTNGGEMLPVMCSGVYGATGANALQAMRDLVRMFRLVLDCGNGRLGLDQGALNAVFYFALQAAEMPHAAVVINPIVSRMRHVFAREHANFWPKDKQGRFLNCAGRPYALLHQLDRQGHIWADVMKDAKQWPSRVQWPKKKPTTTTQAPTTTTTQPPGGAEDGTGN